jgi:glyoxylase-like metal-dependent hydrolase (beta-lactamase superfamily II)
VNDVIANAPYGQVERLSARVRRVLARNPSAFTFTGTGTYIVGTGTVAVIDPGPDDPAHLDALLAAVDGETIGHIVITHTHRDHSPAAVPLKARTGAPVVGCAPIAASEHGPKVEEGFDRSYAPDCVLADGERIEGAGWTLTALHTPGHTSNHLCYTLEEERALFSGDHVMGWSTSVVTPPDGDMADYMASLRKLLDHEHDIYFPTHGPAVTDPKRLVRGLITHRRQREGQILKLLAGGPKPVPALVAVMYANVAPVLHPAAGRSVLAHLIDLQARGLVTAHDDRWSLAE